MKEQRVEGTQNASNEIATLGSPCPFCDGEMQLVDSVEIYGTSYGYLYRCSRYPLCDAYVGCHQGTTRALGTPANRPLRAARRAAHTAFDRLWKGGGWGRRQAYQRLQEILEIPLERAHIAMLTESECWQLCRAVKKGDFRRRYRRHRRMKIRKNTKL